MIITIRYVQSDWRGFMDSHVSNRYIFIEFHTNVIKINTFILRKIVKFAMWVTVVYKQ